MSSLTLEEIQAKHYEQLKKLAQEHFDDMKQFDEARVTIELSNLFRDKQDVLETIEKMTQYIQEVRTEVFSLGKNNG